MPYGVIVALSGHQYSSMCLESFATVQLKSQPSAPMAGEVLQVCYRTAQSRKYVQATITIGNGPLSNM